MIFAVLDVSLDVNLCINCSFLHLYIDEPLVSTVILPQIGELPVHLSIGEVLL